MRPRWSVAIAAIVAVTASALGADVSPSTGSPLSGLVRGVQRTGAGPVAGNQGPVWGDQPLTPPPDSLHPTSPPPAGLPAMLDDRPFARVVPSGGTWAVVIGINRYPGGDHNLLSAVNDADDMVAALHAEHVGDDHILAIRDSQATGTAVLAAAGWLVAHAGTSATAVFFYAGHARKLSAQSEAIVAADGANVTDHDLAARLTGLEARRSWFVMAACYGGGFDELLGPGRILTAAADADHLAYENETFGRSYLVEFMIRAAILDGRASASVQAAFDYASAIIHQRYPGREPVEYGDTGAPLTIG